MTENSKISQMGRMLDMFAFHVYTADHSRGTFGLSIGKGVYAQVNVENASGGTKIYYVESKDQGIERHCVGNIHGFSKWYADLCSKTFYLRTWEND